MIFYITWERSANIGKNTSAGFIGIYCSTGESKQKKHLMTIICESFLLHLYTLAKQIKGTLDHHGITKWYTSLISVLATKLVLPSLYEEEQEELHNNLEPGTRACF